MQLAPAIELNLRLPSMLHGKKGFGRIVWAFKNAKGLQDSFEWLFYDCAPNVVGDGVAPVGRFNHSSTKVEGTYT